MSKQTPLFAAHQRLGGRMVDFSGWSMPVNYGSQLEEHHAVRGQVGMFDVSHMTIIDVSGDDAPAFLRYLMANDVARLSTVGAALYTAMLNQHGGVLDDLIIYLLGENHYRLVVNCGTREKDLTWLRLHNQEFGVNVNERPELAIIAVQGPQARQRVTDTCLTGADKETALAQARFSGSPLHNGWFLARTGYTGEDGFEIILPADQAEACWNQLSEAGVRPCGLGARDTLRLEAGMNLYGHEMDDVTSPLLANMAWTIAWDDDRDFIGRKALEEQQRQGLREKLVGVILEGKGVMREGYLVHVPGTRRTGIITSGTFSPTLGVSIALARVPVLAKDAAHVEIRGKLTDCRIVAPCFVRHGKVVVKPLPSK